MKRKAKRRQWIVRIATTVLMITFTLSCTLKNTNEPDFQYYDQGKNGSSLSDKDLSKFTSSVRRVDGQAESHYKMALHLQRNRRNKLAIEELKKALQQDPSMAKAYNAMGVSYDKLRENSQAIHCYQLALKIDSNLDYVHNNLGYSYLHIGNLEDAIESFQKAIQLNDENKRYRNNLALAYVMNDRYDLAIDQLKGPEDAQKAGETVSKLAHRLGKRNFEKQIISALQTMKFEKTLDAKAKPVPSKPVVIWKKVNEQEQGSGRMRPVVIRRKVEYPVVEFESDFKDLPDDKSSRRKIQTGSTSLSESQNPQHNTTAIKIIPRPIVSRYGSKEEARMTDITVAGNEYEMVAAKDPGKKGSIVSPTDERKKIYGHKHIRVMWEDPLDKPQAQKDTTSENFKGDLKDRSVARKQPIQNEDSLQKQENEFDEPMHLSAFEMVSQTPEENPHSDLCGLQDSDVTTSSKTIEKKTAQPDKLRIEPRVIDVANVFEPAGKEPENKMPIKSAEKLEIVDFSHPVSATRKISPVYAASSFPLEKTEGKGPSIIIVSPPSKDKKIKQTSSSTKEIKTEKRGKDTVELEIANGNGVEGMARRLQYFLKERGFKVVKITNANTFEHITTKIFYYSGHRADVDRIIQEIALCPDERSIIELKNSSRRIKIIIGKDIMKQDKMLATAKFTR